MNEKNFKLPNEIHRTFRIKKIVDECKDMKTFLFEGPIYFLPGQFIMVWIPRVDEKPFTLSYLSENEFGITVQLRGEFTKKLFSMNTGENVGIRGPYGKGFDPINGKTIVVGGGCGSAPIALLIEKLNNPKIILGARSKDYLLFKNRFKGPIITTDDGSAGKKMFASEALMEEIEKEKPDCIYTCGPEGMMKKIVELANEKNIPCQASLERYMKCGFGICGQCACSKKLVCIDGPVFSKEELLKMDDFGKISRTKSGKIINQ